MEAVAHESKARRIALGLAPAQRRLVDGIDGHEVLQGPI
jgi:hypothetical protein